MRFMSLALLLLVVGLALFSPLGTDASCKQAGKRIRDLIDWDEDGSCDRSSYPKVISETVEALAEKVDSDSDHAEASNLPDESFYSKLKRAFAFVYKIVMWYLNFIKE
ncbi:uncharacterized protein LOC117897315 [Drosophila subobscura]|uniref:uncharacterized protein LOC117897315 n=1 Tax=Drosophila subobscura TaxID=7241 RepID=UPI00155AA0B3|nr:uncharacterized protein LOC117897315 [Drosophila subobscura]